MSDDSAIMISSVVAEAGWCSSGGIVQGKEGGGISTSNTVTWLCGKAGKHHLLNICGSGACTTDRNQKIVTHCCCSIADL